MTQPAYDAIAKINKQQSQGQGVTNIHQDVEPYLQIENINKSFGKFVALRDVYLDIYPGEFICLLGPSGCGKTTLLRIIAGLEQQTSGRIIQGGKDISRLPPAKRDFGIVFQSYALFPNLTAQQNIAYGLHNGKKKKQEISQRVQELLTLVGLQGLENKYPAQMSGGQQQRVALARALALSPGLLLLDEPLSALDAQVRVKLRSEITQLQRRLGITTIMVTHDQAEALAMGSRLVVMDLGCIAQIGNPQAVYQRPNTPFVANFIGVMNFLTGEVLSDQQIRCGNIVFKVPQDIFSPSQKVTIAIRPEDIQIVDSESLNLPNIIKGQIESIEYLGSSSRITIRPDGDSRENLIVELPSQQTTQLDFEINSLLTIQLPPELIKVFPL